MSDMSFIDYYDLLQVSPKASAAEVRLAFRLLALKYHPDSNSDSRSNDYFVQITQAYEVLSHPEKRKSYDEVYYEEMRARGPAQKKSFAARTVRDSTAEPRWHEATSTRQGGEELKERLRTYSRSYGDRRGTGREEERDSFFSNILRGFRETLGMSRATIERPREDGSTSSWKKVNPEQLRGERQFYFTIDALESIIGTTRQVALADHPSPVKATVDIPAGVESGTVFHSDAYDERGKVAMVKVKVEVQPHAIVSRENNDIIFNLALTVAEAIEGTEVDIPTLEGPIRVKIPPAWEHGKRLRIKGRGLKSEGAAARGDLYITTHIVVPDKQDPSVTRAAKAMDDFYSKPARPPFPRNLRELRVPST